MDPQPDELEELRAIVEKCKVIVPLYREQNKELRAALLKKEEELEDYKRSNLKLEKLLETYRADNQSKHQTITALCFLLAIVVFLVVGWLIISSSNKPAADLVASAPTAAPTYNYKSTIGKAAAAKSASQSSSSAITSTQKAEIYVWIPQSGKRYHDSKGCSGMQNPKYVTISEAKRLGYTACGTCKPPQ